jgi:hypothetical protein
MSTQVPWSIYINYVTYQVVGLTLFIPWLVSAMLMAFALRKHPRENLFYREWLFYSLAFYLTFWQLTLYFVQAIVAKARPDPFNPGSIYYGFPCQTGFYTAAVITFIFVYAIEWNVPMGYGEWMFTYVFMMAPGATLVWFQYNSWQEVLASMIWGILVMLLYFFIIWIIYPELPTIINSSPWSWSNCSDTWLMTPAMQAECEEIRLDLAEARRQDPFSLWLAG